MGLALADRIGPSFLGVFAMQTATTHFRINFFKSLFTIWVKKISLRYWCRQCGSNQHVSIQYGETYPQFECDHCHTKNIINLKYR